MLLKERFGDDYKISEMWVSKVTETPVIRYGEGRRLQEMADDLRSSKETLGAMNKLEQIDTHRSKVKIVERLPQQIWKLETSEALANSFQLMTRKLLICENRQSS